MMRHAKNRAGVPASGGETPLPQLGRALRRLAASALAAAALSGCGKPDKPDALEELETLLGSGLTESIRVIPGEDVLPSVVELRATAQEMLDAADILHERAVEAWSSRDLELAASFSEVALLYFAAAENWYRASEARQRLEDANVLYQAQLQRRNEYADRLESEEQLITLLEAIQELVARNEELSRQLSTVEEQTRSESRALYAIQEARIEQRTAQGMKAPEFAESEYGEAEGLLARAQTAYQGEDWEEAAAIAMQALEAFRRATEGARPDFLAEQDRLLRDDTNQAIFEEAQRVFPDNAHIDARGLVVTISDLFESRSAEIKQSRAGQLDQVLELLREYDGYSILIEGHTDDRGSTQDNMALSLTRASTVQDYFLQRNVENGRISTAGMGEESPAFDNQESDGRRANNRVEIVFLFD